MRLLKRKQVKSSTVRRRAPKAGLDESANEPAFQKGRTMVSGGSDKSHGSDRLRAHYLVRRRRRIGGLLFVVASLLAAAYVAVSQFTAQAVVAPIDAVSGSDGSIYADPIEAYMADNLREHWRFFLDDGRLTEFVQRESPEVESITAMGSAGLGKSMFDITFRQPIASWSVDGQQLYVDREGVAFSRNYHDPPALRVEDKNDVIVGSGQSVASRRLVSFIGQAVGLLEGEGYRVTDIVIPLEATRQIEVKLQGVRYPIKLSIDRSAGEGVNDTVRAIDWFKSKGVKPLYVDARVRGRVFYQ